MLKKVVLAIILFVGLVFIILSIFVYVLPKDSCSMDVGPFYGKPIETNNRDFDTTFHIPIGTIGFLNTENDSPIHIVRLDKEKKLVWALEIYDSTLVELPHVQFGNIKLIDTSIGKKITFFNHSNSEPGTIYLDENYNFKYMCLKMF